MNDCVCCFLIKGDSILRDLLAKQITHVNIDIKAIRVEDWRIVAEIFQLILSLCERLIDLNFCNMFLENKCSTSVHLLPDGERMSSTLRKLKINVESFVDCLYLLDGRLDCLSTLIIHVNEIFDPIADTDERVSRSSMIMFSIAILNSWNILHFAFSL